MYFWHWHFPIGRIIFHDDIMRIHAENEFWAIIIWYHWVEVFIYMTRQRLCYGKKEWIFDDAEGGGGGYGGFFYVSVCDARIKVGGKSFSCRFAKRLKDSNGGCEFTE